MKTFILTMIAILVPQLALAKELVYRIDYSNSKIDEATGTEICGLPKEIRMDSQQDLPTTVIKKLIARDPKIQTIQATKGSISGGELGEPYTGDYRVRVALVFQNMGYPSDVVTRVEITTFGSPAAPKAFTVHEDLLNYHESAELAEGWMCTGYAYALQ